MQQRATKIDKKKLFIEELLSHNFNISLACKIVGINRSTYYRWLEQTKFKTMLDDAFQRRKDMIEDKLMEEAMSGNTQILTLMAKTICRDRGYVEKTESEVTHKGEGIKLIINQKNE